MPYIDKDYYDIDYEGTPITDADTFSRLSKKASGIVDMLTNHILLNRDFESWAQLIQVQVKKATAAQVEYLFTNGESKAMGAGDFGQVGIGNFNYGDKAGASELSRQQQMVSVAVIQHLRPTGLLYQGVAVRG